MQRQWDACPVLLGLCLRVTARVTPREHSPVCDNPGKGCQPPTGLCLYPQQGSKVTSTPPAISLGILGSGLRAWLNTGVRLTLNQIGQSPNPKPDLECLQG